MTRAVRLLLCALPALMVPAGESGESAIRFNRDIRPLLSDNCYRCHGPDADAREAGLRLDLEEEAVRDRGGYRAIDRDRPARSRLLSRITARDPSERMPPPASGKSLAPEEIGLLTRWIESGAGWEGHWAWQPPVRPPVPEAGHPGWRGHPVDRFIAARLERENLEPSPSADRRTLIRRLSLDLRGLPPTATEVERFVGDGDPFAFERVVDRMLASPAFGERMAVHWLDLVRYADTVGYHGDQPYSVWPYRDYVIGAFNRNLPFDRFTREQIAGDLLESATREQRVASGYNRLHRITAEGGAQEGEYLAKYAADRVRTTASVWMGSTLGCAECHDHKFDPFTARDFYSFAAFFADLKERGFYGGNQWEPRMPLPDPRQERELARLDASIADLEAVLSTPTEELVGGQLAWEERVRSLEEAGALIWAPLPPAGATAREGTELRILADASVLATGANPEKEVYRVILPAGGAPLSALRLEALPHPSLDGGSLSRGGGDFVLTGFEVTVGSGDRRRTVSVARARADFSRKGYEVARAIDGRADTGWAVEGGERKERRVAVFTFAEPLVPAEGESLHVTLRHESSHARHNLGRFRLSGIALEDPGLEETGLPPDIHRAILVPWADRDPETVEALADHWWERTPILDETRRRLARARDRRKRLQEEIPTMLVSRSVAPREMRILPRGDWMDRSGEVVDPALPVFLAGSSPGGERLSRLDLADWLVARDNPLTARTFVNRLWQLHFGRGLSRVPDDLGSQGEWPTHPELLDWLAVEFMESGWDVKHMVRLLVTSRAWRQSSTASRWLRDRDPGNELFARQTAFRIDAEFVRDMMLSLSSLGVDTLGGPSARPHQPPGYYAQLNFPRRTYQADTGPGRYRRGLYTHWQRTFLHPGMKAFDAPSREECTALRPRSNTPLQSLALFNDPSHVEAARAFAVRIVSRGEGEAPDRVRWAFRQALGRSPRPAEAEVLLRLFSESRGRYAADPEAAAELAPVSRSSTEEAPPGDLAAWTMVARALMSLHETITRY